MPSGICKSCGKGQHWTEKCRATIDKWGNTLPKISQGGHLQDPIADKKSFFPQDNLIITAMKADVVRLDNKVESNSIKNSKNLKKGLKMNILANFYRRSKVQA
jgi:hypothetical protein